MCVLSAWPLTFGAFIRSRQCIAGQSSPPPKSNTRRVGTSSGFTEEPLYDFRRGLGHDYQRYWPESSLRVAVRFRAPAHWTDIYQFEPGSDPSPSSETTKTEQRVTITAHTNRNAASHRGQCADEFSFSLMPR